MVKKYVYQIAGTYKIVNDTCSNMLLDFNNDLHVLLKQQKDYISEHYWSKKWDKFKKYANEYELIFTSGYGFPSMSKYSPISRSYFKLWEILYDYKDLLDIKNSSPKKCAFLAEGPGGFIEAHCNFRSALCNQHKDCIYGVTLISNDKNIPSWKLTHEFIQKNNITLLKGKDGTGSLYNIANIISYVNEIGSHACHMVTADGGFDFSQDFNNQEEMSTKLIIAEVYTAVQLQASNGNFLIKVYDIHSIITLQVLFILKELYESLTFIKPLSSRPANSEKYLLCHNFKGLTHPKYAQYLSMLEQLLLKHQTQDVKLDIKIPHEFICDVLEYNVFYILKQIVYINKTLHFIDEFKNDKDDPQLVSNMKHQLEKAIKWCNKYNIAINLDGLHSYNTFFAKCKSIC